MENFQKSRKIKDYREIRFWIVSGQICPIKLNQNVKLTGRDEENQKFIKEMKKLHILMTLKLTALNLFTLRLCSKTHFVPSYTRYA